MISRKHTSMLISHNVILPSFLRFPFLVTELHVRIEAKMESLEVHFGVWLVSSADEQWRHTETKIVQSTISNVRAGNLKSAFQTAWGNARHEESRMEIKVLILSPLKMDYHEHDFQSRNSTTIFTDGHLHTMVQFCQNLLYTCTRGIKRVL